MATGIIGRKLGMTRVFTDDGIAQPVTVIEAGPCPVLQVRESQAQLGWGRKRDQRASKAEVGHAKAAGLDYAPQVVRSFPLGEADLAPGAVITVAMFAEGDLVKVTGTTKGRGFQGVVHRYGFHGGPGSHGNTRHRKPGSIGPGTDPSRVIKGKKMPGHYGDARHTQINLRIEKVDAERNLLYLRGAVAGPKNGIVLVRKQG
jgi:large subunit ribosomal protein L3